MSKIPPKRVLSDDCAVYVGRKVRGNTVIAEGEAYYIHKGEWVEVVAVTTIQQTISLSRLLKAAEEGNEVEAEKNLEILCSAIAEKVWNWNWTDINGKKLPKPHGNSDAIKMLTTDELSWLVLLIVGESQGERKNALPASPSL